jgi:hypothetical protein
LTVAAAAAQTGAQKTELILFFTLLELTIIMLVIMAVLSTIVTTPALRYLMPRAGLKLHA